jgi:hypothetical protein
MIKHMMANAGKGLFWASTNGPESYGASSLAHEQFDKLSGIDAKCRTREDRLPRSLLDKVEAWLDESGADELAKWSHPYLAHAGGPESRSRIAAATVTNNKITQAIRSMARVTEAISAYILHSSGRLNALMPTAQFDQFENLEKPILIQGDQDKAHDLWRRLSGERDDYLENVGDALKPEQPKTGSCA